MFSKLFTTEIFKKNKKIIIISIIFLAGLVFIFSDYGLMKRFSLELELKQKQEMVNASKQVTDSLQKIIRQLQSDSLEIERIAREKYGMSKNNEELFYIKQERFSDTLSE